MYVDASALVSILANEPERNQFISILASNRTKVTSVVSLFETSLAISSLTGSCASAASEVMRFIDAVDIKILPIDGSLLTELSLARDRYGEGSGHPAKLNLGDCFSYALAKQAGMTLLYKGNDFALTDLARDLP